MEVILNRYSGTYDKSDKFSVKVDGQVKCKNMTEEGARAFASKLGGDAGYIDKTAKRSTVLGKLIIDTPEPANSKGTQTDDDYAGVIGESKSKKKVTQKK